MPSPLYHTREDGRRAIVPAFTPRQNRSSGLCAAPRCLTACCRMYNCRCRPSARMAKAGAGRRQKPRHVSVNYIATRRYSRAARSSRASRGRFARRARSSLLSLKPPEAPATDTGGIAKKKQQRVEGKKSILLLCNVNTISPRLRPDIIFV